MKIIFKSKKVEKVCSNEDKAIKLFGKEITLKLERALVALEEAINLRDILNLRFYHLHKLNGNRDGEYSMYLGKTSGYRLILVPLDSEMKKLKSHDQSIYTKSVCVEIEEVSKHYE